MACPCVVVGQSIALRRVPELIRAGAIAAYDLERIALADFAPLLAAHAEASLQPRERARPESNAAELEPIPSFAVIEWDKNLTILRWSDEAETILGIPKREAEGRAVGKWLLPSAEMVPFISGCQSLASGVLGNFKSSCRVRRSDGVSLDANWKVTPHWEKNERYIGIFELSGRLDKDTVTLEESRSPKLDDGLLAPAPLQAQDRPAAPKSDASYVQRAEFLAIAVEQLSIGVYAKEEQGDGVFTVWNTQMERLFQIDKEAVVGKTIDQVFADPLLRAILGEAKQPHSRSRAIVPRHGAGSETQTNFIADITKTPILDDSGHAIALIGIVHDVTERIQSENRLVSAFNELESSKEKLEQSNLEIRKGIEKAKKLAIAAQASNRAKSFFLSNISHELRTPLTSIISLTHALLEGTFGPMTAKQKEYLEIVSDSSAHLQALITDILDLSKIELGKLNLAFTRVPIAEIAQASVRMVMQQAETKNVQCELSLRSAAESIDVDPKRLRQMLLNLLFNAVKFTQQNTTISLKVESDRLDESVRFTVADEGIGIHESDIEKIFTPFTQLDDSLSKQYEGTGLGLAIVSKLVELHGGSLSVTSQSARGAAFTITLPIDQDTDEEAPPPESLAEIALSGHDESLAIVVDENERLAACIQRSLLRFGYQRAVVAMPNELSAYFDQVAPAIIVADLATVSNQGSDWIQLARAHSSWSQTAWVAISSLDISSSRKTAQEMGFDLFLPKPITQSSLQSLA